MQYRTDTRSGRELSILGFGCMRFKSRMGAVDQKKADKLVRMAIDGGVNYFDTAYIYGEEALGTALVDGLRDRVYIADKLPLFLVRKPSDFERFFTRQLERLKTDHIDYYLCHMLQDSESWERLCSFGIEEWFSELKRSGRVGQIGFSSHAATANFCGLLDVYDWDFCQMQYNYADENNQAGKTGLMKAAEKDIPVMVMEPLLGGKLVTSLPPAASDAFCKANPSYSPAEWGLRWVWNHPEATVVLSGMNEESQLTENLRIAGASRPGMLTEYDMAVYENVQRLFRSSFKVPCTGCGYCMPCPHGVDIPGCFAAYNSSFTLGKGQARGTYMRSTGAVSRSPRFASLCKGCGRCEKLCPQSIPIMSSLKETAKAMEPAWFRAGTAVARRFTK